MILTTHAITGAAIVSVVPTHPLLGICMAFASHYLLDAIPHYDYPLRSAFAESKPVEPRKLDRGLVVDVLAVGADAMIGIVLGTALFAQSSIVFVFLGACAAIAPDGLQFAYMLFPREPLASLQRFHGWMHSSHAIRDRLLGLGSQLALMAGIFVMVRTVLPSL